MKLLIATHNPGKVIEFAGMLADLALEWLSLDDAGVTADVAETGQTFRENAVLKAQTYARMTGLFTLADDSGLEVDALNGEPGVYTARYGGEGLTSMERYQLLLQRMRDVPWADRTARFHAVIALVAPDGRLLGVADGVCEGLIALAPTGWGGFGYDPVFYLPDRERTMAQLDAAVKRQISHRGRALRSIEALVQTVLAQPGEYEG